MSILLILVGLIQIYVALGFCFALVLLTIEWYLQRDFPKGRSKFGFWEYPHSFGVITFQWPVLLYCIAMIVLARR